jgi:hypothetical protein
MQAGRQLAQQDLQRMPPVQLIIAVGDQHQSRAGLDPPGQQPDHVESRLVSPVQILDDDDRGPASPDFGHQRRSDLIRQAARHDGGQRAAFGLGDVQEGPERPGGEQRIAGTGHHARPARRVTAERSDQFRLADACFTADGDQPSLTGGRHAREVAFEPGELSGTFEQLSAACQRLASWARQVPPHHGRVRSAKQAPDAPDSVHPAPLTP